MADMIMLGGVEIPKERLLNFNIKDVEVVDLIDSENNPDTLKEVVSLIDHNSVKEQLMKKYADVEAGIAVATPERLAGKDMVRASTLQIPFAKMYEKEPEEYATPKFQGDTMKCGIKWDFWGIEDFKEPMMKKFESDFEDMAEYYNYELRAMRDHLKISAKRLGLTGAEALDDSVTSYSLKTMWLEMLWEKMSNRMKNPGLAISIQETETVGDGVGFLSSQLTLPGAPSLENTYGYGYDTAGVYRFFDEDDLFNVWAVNRINPEYAHPLFLYSADRDKYFADQLIDLLRYSYDTSVLSLGAGLMPELRFHGYDNAVKMAKVKQTIYACDNDESLDVDGLIFDEHEALWDVLDFHTEDMVDAIKNLRMSGAHFNLVYAKGIVSFVLDKAAILISQGLALGDKFLFDVQFDSTALQWLAHCDNWAANGRKLNLLKKPDFDGLLLKILGEMKTKELLPESFTYEKNVQVKTYEHGGQICGAYYMISR